MLLAYWPAAASDLSTYRGFVLGTAAVEVLKQAGAASRDLKTVHERPALLQELSWRPPYVIGLEAADQGAVANVSFSFIDDQLFRMIVDYDRGRTEGLTAADLIAALSAKYGPRSTQRPTAGGSSRDSLDAPTAVALWQAGDTAVTLNRFAYSGRFALTITSVRLQAQARTALTAAVAMDAREAPAREAERARIRADAERAAAEKTRTDNKARFEP